MSSPVIIAADFFKSCKNCDIPPVVNFNIYYSINKCFSILKTAMALYVFSK